MTEIQNSKHSMKFFLALFSIYAAIYSIPVYADNHIKLGSPPPLPSPIKGEGDKNADDYIQLQGVIHVHSNFSTGRHSIEELAKIAIDKGIEVLIITDHDLITKEYGPSPFRHIFRWKEKLPSVLDTGVGKYLQEIKDIDKRYPQLIVIPGVESSPFYYWTGNPLKKDLTAHNWKKHILIIGLRQPEDYANLPILHNKITDRYFKKLIWQEVPFFIPLLLSIFLIRWKGGYRVFGILTLCISILAVINYHPFKSSLYDQYHGDQGTGPYQELIDYAALHGGMTFWAHPESHRNTERYGPIIMKTPVYVNDLLNTTNYTGMEAVYEDTIHMTDNGREWDRMLIEYCNGKRKRPVWGIGGIDFHGEEGAGKGLDNVLTIFLVKKKNNISILDSLRNGKTYSLRRFREERLSLDDFSVSDSVTQNRGMTGDKIVSRGSPIVNIKISSSGDIDKVNIELIRSGRLLKIFTGKTPFNIEFKDDYYNPGEKIYYRLNIRGKNLGYIISNPVFVKFT
ncbi:MAG: PHP domain-containing protein [Nitrospinota bacterium]